MDVRTAVAVAPGQPLTVETKQLEGSRAGNVNLMRQALECCHKGWGVSVICFGGTVGYY